MKSQLANAGAQSDISMVRSLFLFAFPRDTSQSAQLKEGSELPTC